MAELDFHGYAVIAMFVFAVLTFLPLLFVTAPYGRYRRDGWGPTIPNRVAWVVMESPAVFLYIGIFVSGDNRAQLVPLVLLGMWQLHYVNRTLIYPFRERNKNKRMPVSMMGTAFVFNILNAYVNARWISHFGEYTDSWLTDPRFLIGTAVFLFGWFVNTQSDSILRRLRKPGETGYEIPRGGFYRWITCPNYFGEIVEWIGWAIATWSPAGLAFAVYTAANLAPRARSNHQWYQKKFDDYPRERKALIPFLV